MLVPITPAHVSKRNRAINQIANAFLHAAIGRLARVQPQKRQIGLRSCQTLKAGPLRRFGINNRNLALTLAVAAAITPGSGVAVDPAAPAAAAPAAEEAGKAGIAGKHKGHGKHEKKEGGEAGEGKEAR